MTYSKIDKTLTVSRNTAINVSFAVLIMLAGALITATITFQNLRNQVDNNLRKSETNQSSIEKLTQESVSAQVQFSEIQAQLKSIDTNLVEIKTRLGNR